MVGREELGALGIAQPKGGDKGVLRWVGCEKGTASSIRLQVLMLYAVGNLVNMLTCHGKTIIVARQAQLPGET